MAETTNTRGIVLYYEPWRDVDRSYVLYTEQFGKVRAKAIGIRRSKAKLAGVLEPFAEVELYLIASRYQYKIGGAVVQQRFTAISQELARYNAALYCVEVFHRLTKEAVPDTALYLLLYSTLTWLDRAPYSRLVVLSFVVKLVQQLGYDLLHTVQRPEDVKVLRWLASAPYQEVQKLRLDATTWQALYQGVHLWLYEYLGDDVQSEQFLV